jgi:hypothetical protein
MGGRDRVAGAEAHFLEIAVFPGLKPVHGPQRRCGRRAARSLPGKACCRGRIANRRSFDSPSLRSGSLRMTVVEGWKRARERSAVRRLGKAIEAEKRSRSMLHPTLRPNARRSVGHPCSGQKSGGFSPAFTRLPNADLQAGRISQCPLGDRLLLTADPSTPFHCVQGRAG